MQGCIKAYFQGIISKKVAQKAESIESLFLS